jgi:uncharacterized OsmC-like protein
VTTVGVAYRGQIPLENVAVDLQFQSSSAGGEERCGVREKVTFKGAINGQQQQRLDRTIDYCPVGQFLGKGSVTIEDQIDHQARSRDESWSRPASGFEATSALVPGTVHAQYLPETKVWKAGSSERILEHEGEVKLYFTCRSPDGLRRWVMLSGHTLSWNPIPMHLAFGGLASSTVSTLRQILAPAPLGPEDLKVEVEMERGSSSGGRQNAQAAAADGVVRKYHVMRRITVGGRMRGVSTDTIHAALQQDPVSRYYRDGNILTAKEIVVTG